MAGTFVERIDPELAELIDRFLECSRQDLGRMAEALARRDFDTLGRLGHSAKGAGAGYGFTGLRDLGREIEAAAKSGDGDACSLCLERLGAYLANVRVDLA